MASAIFCVICHSPCGIFISHVVSVIALCSYAIGGQLCPSLCKSIAVGFYFLFFWAPLDFMNMEVVIMLVH